MMEKSTFGTIRPHQLKTVCNSDIPRIALSIPLKPSSLHVSFLANASIQQLMKSKEHEAVRLMTGGGESIYSKRERFRLGLMKAWAENKDVVIFDPKA